MTRDFEFGNRYFVKAEMVRSTTWDLVKGVLTGHVWKRIEFDQPVQALYIGYRNVFDGEIVKRWSYDDRTFKRTKTHRVAMFVINERSNPIRVLFDDVDKREAGK